MENLFIPYEQALKLKELGFDEPCLRFKNNISNIIEEKGWLNWNEVEMFVSLPLWQQAFDWFRKEYIELLKYDYGNVPHISLIQNLMIDFNYSYEEAQLACLDKLIEIVENK